MQSNVIGKPGQFIGSSSGAGAPDVHYAAGPWRLAPDVRAQPPGRLCCAGSAPDGRVAAGCAQEALVIDGVFPSAEDCAFANVLLVNKFLQSLDCAHPPRNLRLIMFEQEPIRGASRDRV